MKYQISIKRVYESVDDSDGARVLVDRLWPRGKRREDLVLTEWYRDAAPSNELRRSWHNGNIDTDVFAKKYDRELRNNPDTLIPLMRWARQGRLTLLTAVRNPDESHAPVLKTAIEKALGEEDLQDRQGEPSSPTCYAGTDDFRGIE